MHGHADEENDRRRLTDGHGSMLRAVEYRQNLDRSIRLAPN